MINISVERGRIEAKGHANFAPKGQDIVCAGVTSSLLAAFNILQSLHGEDNVDAVFDEGNMWIEVKNRTLGTDLVQKGFKKSMKMLEMLYPENIKVEGEI